MSTINLDEIMNGMPAIRIYSEGSPIMREEIKDCIRIAIHQALVLASDNARVGTTYPFGLQGESRSGVIKQSILDIEKLIK